MSPSESIDDDDDQSSPAFAGDPKDATDLLTKIPLFPLSGVILLPRGFLPLNIFEPRYLHMIDDALANDRMVGMIQPLEPGNIGTSVPQAGRGKKQPPLQAVGCAGRIVRFDEEQDGRYEVILRGVSRFSIISDRLARGGYRLGTIDYKPFEADFMPWEGQLDREQLEDHWKDYFKAHNINIDWENLSEREDERMINTLAMLCPFDPMEKQALLECPELLPRMEMLTSLMQMSVLTDALGQDERSVN